MAYAEGAEVNRPYADTPHAKMLRQMQAGGLGYHRLAAILGYARATIQHAATGRNHAGPCLQRDIESLWKEFSQ